MIKLDYKDTDKKLEIEIYGLIFEIKKEIEEINANEINDAIEIIDKILGTGAKEKINKKRVEDGYSEMDTQVALAIISTAVNAYVNASTKPVENIVNNYTEKERKFRNFRRNYKYRRY